MAMFKKRISEESSASESQWSNEQIQTAASVRPNLNEFGRKPQGSFADDVVTTSIHWVSFEDLPNKDKDAAVGENQLKWPSWKKGSAKFSKALSSSTLSDRPEADLTGRISSICRPLSAYGSVRNMDRSIVTATVAYQTDKGSVEETEHINSTEDRATFNNDSIDSGHEGNSDEEEDDEQRDESLSSNPLNCSNSSVGESCNTPHVAECAADQTGTWQDNNQFSSNQRFGTEDIDSKCTGGIGPHHIQQVPEKMELVGFPNQQAGLAGDIGDCDKDQGNEDGVSATIFTHSNYSSSQPNDSERQPPVECTNILHRGGSMRNNDTSGIDQTDGHVRRVSTVPVVSKSPVAVTSTNCAWNETNENMTIADVPERDTTKSVKNLSCKSSGGTSEEAPQNDSCPNGKMNSYESREVVRSKEDNYALFAREAPTREEKKETEPARSGPRVGGLDGSPSRYHVERRSSEDEGFLTSGHLSQVESAYDEDVSRHSRITQQTCSASNGEGILQETTSLEEIPSADESMHPYPQMEETSEEESEYCQCSTDGTAAHHEVQAAQPDDSPDARQIEKTNSISDDIASMQQCMENLQNEDTSSDRRKTCTKDDDSCPAVEKEDDSLQPTAQERINDNKTRRSRNSSEDLDADRHEQMFPSQMTSSSPLGSPPRLLSSGNPPKQSNSPRRRGSPRIDQIADKLLKNAVVLVERLPRSITDKASQKAKDKVETAKATGNSNQAVDAATTSSVGVAPRNISIDASIASGSSKELRQPSSAPPKKRDMKKLLPKPSEPQRYADGMYPYVPNATAIPFYPSTHGPVVQHRGQQVTMPPPPNGLQYQFAPHGAQYPLGSLQHNHDNGAHQRFYAPYPGVNPRYLPPSTATAGFRNSTYPDALQTPSNQPLQQPNPSLVVRIREVGPESILATQNRALGSQQMTNNTTPIYHLPQGAMESSAAMHQRPRFVYHPNESSSLRESRQGAMSSQGTLATDSRKPPSLIDAVIEEMYDREEPTAAQQTSAWRPSTTANRTERPVIPEVLASSQASGLKENREVKSAMNLVDRMIENAYFSSKAEVKEADVPPAKEVRPFGHSRYSPPLTVSMSDGGPSVHSTPPAHPKDFMSALVARVVDEEYAKDDVVVNVPERLRHDRQLQDNGSPPRDQPDLPGPMAKPQENPTSNQKQEDERCRFANASSEQPMYDSLSLPMGDDALSNQVDATIQDDQGREEESTTGDVASDTQDRQVGQAAEIPSPRNADSDILSENPKLENLNTSESSIPGSENHQRPDLEAILPRHVDNSASENGHRCATDRVEPQSNPLMPSQENRNGEKCPTVTHITNNGLPTKEKNLQGNNNASSSGDNVDDSSPRKTSRDSTSNEQSFEEEFPAVSKDLTRSSPTEVGSETADQLLNLQVELAEASDLVVDEETALNHRDDALNEEVGRTRSESEVDATTAPPNEQAGSGEVRGEHTSSALTDDKSGPKRGGRPKGRKRVVEGRQKKSMTRDRDKAESSAASEARIAHEFPRHNWLMKHLMAEQQLVTNRKDSERRSPDGGDKNRTDPNEEEGKEEEGGEQEKVLSEVEGIAIDKDKRRRSKRGTLSRDSSMESCTSLDTLSSTDKLDGEDDSVFPCPVSPSTAAEKKSLPTLDIQEVSQPKSHSLTASIAEKSTEDSNTADNNTDSGVKDLSTESTAIKSSASADNHEPPQTLTARHSQEEPLNLSLKAARFVDFYNSIGSKNIAKVPESKQAHAGESTTAEQVDHDTEYPADNGDSDKDTKSHVVASSTPLESGLKTGPSAAASPPAERASVEQSPKPPKHLSESGSRTPITVTVHTASMTSATRQASDSTKSSSPGTKPPREASAMGNVQDRPTSRSSTSMFSFEDVPKDERATRQDSHQGTGPKRPASPTVRCPPRKRSTVDSGVVCVSPYSPVSPSDKTTSQATKIQEETPKRRANSASLPETATTTPHQFVVPSHQAVLPSKKSASQTLRAPSGQERPSVISAVPVTPPLPPRPAAPPPPPNEPPYRADQSITAALLARLEVMTKNKVNIERELVNQELLLSELRKRVVEDKSGLLRKQSQEKEALLFHMRMTYHKLCEDIDYLMRSGPPKFADGLKSLRSMAPNSTGPNSIGHSSQAIPIHRAQSDSAITLQAGGKMGGEANRWREIASNERRSSDGENSSDVQIIGQKGPTISSSLQDFRHANPHIPPYLDPRYVADARQAIVYGNTTGQQYSPAVSTVTQNHVSPRSVAPRFSPYAQAQAQAQAQNDMAAATAAERRRQAHMDVKRAKQILNEHKSFVEKYSRPGEGNQHNVAGNEVQLNAPAANTVIPQAPVQAGVQTSTIHPYPHGVPIHQTVTMAQVMPVLPGDPSFASRSAAIAHMVGTDQRPLPAMAHQGMHPFYYINPGMPVPGYQQQPIPGQSPRVMNPVTQQLLSASAGQQTPTSTQNHQLNTLLGAHRLPNVTSNVSINSKEPPAAQHHPVLLTGKPTPGQMCHHHQQQQYGWPGQLPTNSEMKAAYFAAHAAQHAAKVQSRAEAAMKRDAMKDHLQRAANVVALPEMQQAAYLSKHFKPFAVTAPEGTMHPSKTHPAHLQQARSQHKEHPMVGQTTREAAYLQEIQLYHANNQPASVFRGNPMMRGPPSVENGQGGPSTMGPTRRDNSGVVSIADDEYHSCVVCNKEATFLCSGCRKAWYCSPTCQVQAWEKHSEDCL